MNRYVAISLCRRIATFVFASGVLEAFMENRGFSLTGDKNKDATTFPAGGYLSSFFAVSSPTNIIAFHRDATEANSLSRKNAIVAFVYAVNMGVV